MFGVNQFDNSGEEIPLLDCDRDSIALQHDKARSGRGRRPRNKSISSRVFTSTGLHAFTVTLPALPLYIRLLLYTITMLLSLSFALLALRLVAGDNDYHYFDFTRQWSPNSCYKNSHACKHLPDNIRSWTIHGLWPSLDATHYPQDCGGSTCALNSTEIKDLLDEMHVKWPTDFKGGDTKFWSHEYCKHGTCCQDILPLEHDYFGSALRLHATHDMDLALAAAGMEPSTTTTYSVAQMDGALKSAFNVDRATYWCRFVKDEDGESVQLLFQLSVCIDKNLKPMDCPAVAHESCDRNKQFYLLPFSVLYN